MVSTSDVLPAFCSPINDSSISFLKNRLQQASDAGQNRCNAGSQARTSSMPLHNMTQVTDMAHRLLYTMQQLTCAASPADSPTKTSPCRLAVRCSGLDRMMHLMCCSSEGTICSERCQVTRNLERCSQLVPPCCQGHKWQLMLQSEDKHDLPRWHWNSECQDPHPGCSCTSHLHKSSVTDDPTSCWLCHTEGWAQLLHGVSRPLQRILVHGC